ncbi:hypothetical protein CVT24_006669 [Panaeolus cyanescens]|uniref:Uncharacterized protein n=1 Tax=Panaeolus cyanescens TaxID=181874 RepID=A0A409X964_9AGAR|nr:hypothetical protein CVT24_006669 [Panaeolus cyanescens]
MLALSAEEWDTLKSDTLLRCLRFSKVVTGLDCLPIRPASYTLKLSDAPVDSQQNQLLVPYIHTCFNQIELFLNDALIRAIEEADVSLGFDTAFDKLIHEAVFDLGSKSFNA